MPQGVTVEPALNPEKSTLQHLLQLYLHDLSEFDDLSIRGDGTFAYPHLERYWADADRHAFLVRVEGRLAGFALVREERRVQMAEFFIVRDERRTGVGAAAARQLFDRFPAPWEVRQVPRNYPAQAFWRKVIQEYTGGRFHEWVASDGDIVQHFEGDRGA